MREEARGPFSSRPRGTCWLLLAAKKTNVSFLPVNAMCRFGPGIAISLALIGVAASRTWGHETAATPPANAPPKGSLDNANRAAGNGRLLSSADRRTRPV